MTPNTKAKLMLGALLLGAAEAGFVGGAWLTLAGVGQGRVRVENARRPQAQEWACRSAAIAARVHAEEAWRRRGDAEDYRGKSEQWGLQAAALLGRSEGDDVDSARIVGGAAGFWARMAGDWQALADEAQARSMTAILEVLEKCR